MIQKKDCQGVYNAMETTISAVECEIIRHCARNDITNNFVKKFHIVEHKPVQKKKRKNIDLLVFS